MEQKQRYHWIDFGRVMAVFGVVLCHATESVYSLKADFMGRMSMQSRVFAFSSFAIGRTTSVPIFLMITGYLLLDRSYNRATYEHFLRYKWKHLLFCTWIWFIIYTLFLIFVQNQKMSMFDIIGSLLFVKSISMGHVWYLPMILGMYLLLPFVATALKNMDTAALRIPLMVFMLTSFAVPFCSVIIKVAYGKGLSLKFSSGFSGGAYGIYILLGYIIKQGKLKHVPCLFLCLTFIGSIVGSTCFQMWAYAHNYTYNVWYNNPLVLVGSVTLFELLSRLRIKDSRDCVHKFAAFSFGIYLIHMPVLRIIKPTMISMHPRMPVQTVILWGAGLFFSYIAAWLIARIPRIGNYILYINKRDKKG